MKIAPATTHNSKSASPPVAIDLDPVEAEVVRMHQTMTVSAIGKKLGHSMQKVAGILRVAKRKQCGTWTPPKKASRAADARRRGLTSLSLAAMTGPDREKAIARHAEATARLDAEHPRCPDCGMLIWASRTTLAAGGVATCRSDGKAGPCDARAVGRANLLEASKN